MQQLTADDLLAFRRDAAVCPWKQEEAESRAGSRGDRENTDEDRALGGFERTRVCVCCLRVHVARIGLCREDR
ncbi:uncharacterized protein V6R79_005472 [Siganus canaliculatus]